ncbi:hypothetical protein [Streptomyces sp. SID5785]|uniref:hypothetical protein n=1 Tax=Streptomyces sp. SID5785 TaxID=2690309 RepID=UPI001925A09D|nr:hypothetical protein [Streptomyces sp. SID5785]
MTQHHRGGQASAPPLSELSGGRPAPRWLPAPVVIGFVALLLAMFAASYAVGHLVGPVAPGMRGTSTGDGTDGGPRPGGAGGMDMDHGSGG